MTVYKKVVQTPPKFVEKLSSTKVNFGETVNLVVKAEGNPTPNLTWLKVNKASSLLTFI